MLYSITTILGAVAGAIFARSRGGNGFDTAQYAGVFAVMGFILGIVATIVIARFGG